ncbi:hypothetical protein Cgig2_001781 [Carnegiea gigantea]|uniref:Pentatricopeptide repeat-containing protein n=1 Tax=Carnegiea gigantea TaxID=171969 RepID=A0A9Q1KG08_9CARY|nr:hypothetical protein Cgig2_001781 [Carnegiea gigantea]
MPEKNWVCYSAIIASFIQNSPFIDGLKLFKEMRRRGLRVSQSTYASVFRSCARLSALRLGCQLHAYALKNRLGTDIIIATTSKDMYAKCQRLADSRRVFNSLPIRSVQCYNAMIVWYIQNSQGCQLYGLAIKNNFQYNVCVANAILDMYAKCSAVVGAQGVLDEMLRWDAVPEKEKEANQSSKHY